MDYLKMTHSSSLSAKEILLDRCSIEFEHCARLVRVERHHVRHIRMPLVSLPDIEKLLGNSDSTNMAVANVYQIAIPMCKSSNRPRCGWLRRM